MMPDTENTKELFLKSVARCGQSPTFVSDFYTLFTSMSPTVQQKFARTDLALQGVKLLRSLNTLASAVAGEAEGLKELAERAETHNRHHLNITPDLYELWQTALMATAQKHDEHWSPQIEGAWNHTLDILVNYMTNRY